MSVPGTELTKTARNEIVRREYPDCADPAQLASRLGLTPAQLRSLARYLGVKRLFRKPAFEDITTERARRIQAEYPACKDTGILAIHLGISRSHLYALASQMGLTRPQQKPGNLLKNRGNKSSRESRRAAREATYKVIREEYPTCESASELAEQIGIPATTLRVRASTLGVRRLRRSSVKRSLCLRCQSPCQHGVCVPCRARRRWYCFLCDLPVDGRTCPGCREKLEHARVDHTFERRTQTMRLPTGRLEELARRAELGLPLHG